MDASNETGSGAFPDPIPVDEARDAVRRLVENPAFKATERNRRFLAFVAEETLAGRGDAIKAYSIAVDVFQRPESFDPSTDPIVRIEATRLRASLAEYYGGDGIGEPIRIDLPKGRYVPTFVRAAPAATALGVADGAAAEAGETVSPPFPTEARPDGRRLPIAVLGAAAAVAAAVGAYALLGPSGTPPTVSDRPAVSLSLQNAEDASESDAVRVRDKLVMALSRFRTLRITSAEAPGAARGNGDDGVSSRYRVDLKLTAAGLGHALLWQLVDARTMETLRSGLVRARDDAAADGEDDLVGTVANDIGGPRGAILTEELSREMVAPTLGNGCVVRAETAIRSQRAVSLETARACLEATLAARPSDADAMAMLALVMVQLETPGKPTSLTPRALALARRAADLDPLSDRAALALSMARYRDGQIEAAVSAGRQAVALNPNNGLVAARLGSLLFITGSEAEGMEVVERAERIGGLLPEVLLARAMDRYRHGRYDEALVYLNRMDDPRAFGPGFVRLATLGQLGRIGEVDAFLAASGTSRERLEGAFYPMTGGRHMSGPLVRDLREGLVKAGFRIPEKL